MNNVEYEERQFVEDSMNKLISFLGENDNWQTPHRYIIQEYFPFNKPKGYKSNVYELDNLTMICEDGMVFSNDIEDKLLESYHVITMFLVESIVWIGFQKEYITISFADGYIRIYY